MNVVSPIFYYTQLLVFVIDWLIKCVFFSNLSVFDKIR